MVGAHLRLPFCLPGDKLQSVTDYKKLINRRYVELFENLRITIIIIITETRKQLPPM